MQAPLRIAAQGYELPPSLESLIRERAAWLERFYPSLVGCSVIVEGPGPHHRQGTPVRVQLDLRVPGGEPLLVTRQARADVETTLREAFDAGRRRLEDFARRQRGDVKRHQPRLEGTVARLLPDEDCGFLLTADGREVYFHRHAVLPPGFAALSPGARVRLVEEQGVEGPQASTVEAL
jgi:cold shock CspA family protein